MNIIQETLPVTKGWVQVKSIPEFNRLLNSGQKVFFQCNTPFDRYAEENDLVNVCGSKEGIFINNLESEKGSGRLSSMMGRLYPEVRAALGVASKFIEETQELLTR